MEAVTKRETEKEREALESHIDCRARDDDDCLTDETATSGARMQMSSLRSTLIKTAEKQRISIGSSSRYTDSLAH